MAAVDYFLKIDGIEGESQDSKHKNEIELLGWSWGAEQKGSSQTGMGQGSGKVYFKDFHVRKLIDKSSPKLMLACANGEHIKKAVLIARKAGKEQQEYLKITFEHVLVSSYTTGPSVVEEVQTEYKLDAMLPIDSISLNFGKVQMEYKPQKADGSLDAAVVTGWDLKQNIKV
jgi:type VI secretion system secreted protein Hcp